jgi:hypothetical protein
MEGEEDSVSPADSRAIFLAMPRRNLLIALVLVLAAGVAAGAWWLVRTPAAAPSHAGAAAPVPPDGPREPEPDPAKSRATLESLPDTSVESQTTVAFPVEIELELVASAVAPRAEGEHALGSDATARIAGSVTAAAGQGVASEVLFVAGSNEGRLLRGGRDGKFGANDLYPGLSVVRISAVGQPGAMREVLLRKDRESLLNVAFARPAYVQGAVVDSAGKPVPAAKVTVDGQEAQTDDAGEFVIAAVAGGDTFAIAEKPGYASYREKLTIVAGQQVEKGRLTFVLRKPARLEITIEDRLNVEGQASVFLLPDPLDATRDFPWYRVNPVRLYPGGTVTVEDLPPRRLSIRLFHAGAVAKPPTRSVTLVEGATEHVALHLEPAPALTGVVTQNGAPASNAEVVLEAPDRSGASLSVLGESNYLDLEREVLPDFPPAVQKVKTNAAGEFLLSSCETVTPKRYLHATSADGRSTAWKLLKPGDTRVELALAPAQGEGRIVVEMDGRTQGLPVEVKVNGTPRDASVLPAHEDLKIDKLAPGGWKLTARWHGEPIVTDMPIELHEEVAIELVLPQGAVVGQDAETRKRAGK